MQSRKINDYSPIWLFWIVIWIFTGIGCNKPLENPELHDPIYQDLKKLSEVYQKSFEEAAKKREEALAKVDKTAPNTIDLKMARREFLKIELEYKKSEQLAKYFQIRADRRMFEGRKQYLEAFKLGKHWPEAGEYQAFVANLKLRDSNRNWNARVPSLKDRYSRNPSTVSAKPAAKKEENEE